MRTIQTHIDALYRDIHQAEADFGRVPGSVLLLAISKRQPIDAIQQAIACGLHAFGENYVQEAIPKITALTMHSLEWHFVGTIQRNKTRLIAEHFHWVHSVDDPLIAERLNHQRPSHLPPLNICIEVNISDERSKSGISPESVEDLLKRCRGLPRLTVRGLMALPMLKMHIEEQRAEFRKLHALYETLNQKGYGLDTLSMGTTHDFKAAIAEGATLIRIGTAIFGERF